MDSKLMALAVGLAAWGFGDITVGGPEGMGRTGEEIGAELIKGAKERGIDHRVPSDGLDASRDLIVDDAVGPEGEWEIANDVLHVAYGGMPMSMLIQSSSD